MHALVKELADGNDFDLVLFDTPPVLGLADAALVAEHCDGLMLLVSLNRVDRDLPKEAVARITSSGAPLLGVVTNAIKREQQAGAYGSDMATANTAMATESMAMAMAMAMAMPLQWCCASMPTTAMVMTARPKRAQRRLPLIVGNRPRGHAAVSVHARLTADAHGSATALSHRLGVGG